MYDRPQKIADASLSPAVEVQPDDEYNIAGAAARPTTPAQRSSPSPPGVGSPSSSTPSTMSADILDIQTLLWGATIKADIFERWSQGFVFSESEPSALVQHQGGPCAVIAPVQAFLLQILLREGANGPTLAELTPTKCRTLLVQALCTILAKCQTAPHRFRIVALKTATKAKSDVVGGRSTVETNNPTTMASEADADCSPTGEQRPTERAAASTADDDDNGTAYADDDSGAAELFDPSLPADPSDYHRQLHTIELDTIEAVHAHYAASADQLSRRYGVLLFTYSVLLTKRLVAIEAELLDTSEPLIHEVYGYASQALINLMLTGRAVANVWDNDQDVGGLKLKGIDRQSDVGFITLMEQMRYCTVGSFYKNPKSPVWVMGSETHLSVLFSDERRLVSPETPGEIGRRVFKSFDPDGNNFIATTSLQEVLAALDLVSETEYVELMQKRLDPEALGIILLNCFMDEFFSDYDRPSVPDSFDLLHYNGIPGSNDNQQVKYNRGYAVLLESDLKTMCQQNNPMLTCLQTKWPTIEVNWTMASGKLTPSLN